MKQINFQRLNNKEPHKHEKYGIDSLTTDQVPLLLNVDTK